MRHAQVGKLANLKTMAKQCVCFVLDMVVRFQLVYIIEISCSDCDFLLYGCFVLDKLLGKTAVEKICQSNLV